MSDRAGGGVAVSVRIGAPATHRRADSSAEPRVGHDGAIMNDSKPPLRVLLVDDHELIRHGLATVFAAQGVDVVGQAGTVAEALTLYAAHRPDSVVTDLQLPDGTGLDVVRSIRRTDKDVGLVVLTMHAGDEQIFAAMEAGASAFVGKDAPSSEVVKADPARGRRARAAS